MKTILLIIVVANIMVTFASSQVIQELLDRWLNRPTPKLRDHGRWKYRRATLAKSTTTNNKSGSYRGDDGEDGGLVGTAMSIHLKRPKLRKTTCTPTVTTPVTTGFIQTTTPISTPTSPVSQRISTSIIAKTLIPNPTPTKDIVSTSTRETVVPAFTRQIVIAGSSLSRSFSHPGHTSIKGISFPTTVRTGSVTPKHTLSRENVHPKPSPTKRGIALTTVEVHPTKHTTKTPENQPKKINKDLQGLMKKNVTKKNVKEVTQNMTKIFKKHPAKDMTKDDAVMAAQLLENIVAEIEMLNETADNVVGFIDSMMEMNASTLAESGSAAAKIIKVLDKLVKYIPFKEGESSIMMNKTNLVLQANLIDPETFQGIDFGVNSNVRQKRSIPKTSKKSTSIKLPQEVVKGTNMSTIRVGFVFYAFNKLFQSNETQEGEVGDTVISGSVFGMRVDNLTEPVVVGFPRQQQRSEIEQCVFWVESDRQWSNAGCSLCPKQSSSETVECCCNHLTSFAVLFSPEQGNPSASEVHQKILSIISYVGCIISIICVVFTFITYSMFRHLRKTNQQPILMNLCIAIALLLIVFVSGINSTDNRLGCQIVAVLLHYLTLVTVLWMGIEAYNLYLQIVKVMAIYQRRFMLKAALVGWGAPLLIVLGTLGAAIVQYKKNDGQIEFYYGSKNVCIIHNELFRLVSWFGPVLVIIFLNVLAFIAIVFKLNTRHSTIPTDSKTTYIKNCWTALAIMCLLGLTWLFGALAISDARIVFEYLFCIFNSLQGFFIFFFHCIRIKEVRSQWSLFVSGLGLSHGDSENSQRKSGVSERLRKDSELQPMRTFAYGDAHDRKQPKRKITVVTVVGEDGCDPNNAVNFDNRTFSNSSHNSTHL